MSTPYLTRCALPDDAPMIAALLVTYMRETFDKTCPVTAEVIRRDGYGVHFDTVIAVRDGTPVGFAAWSNAYDLHWGITGGGVLDMFVVPEHRARGVAAMIVARMCERVCDRGGVFLRGQAVDERSSRLYGRVAAQLGTGEFIVAGRALRAFAGLADADPRTIVRSLPDPAWNLEP